jgi:hypothetical protein
VGIATSANALRVFVFAPPTSRSRVRGNAAVTIKRWWKMKLIDCETDAKALAEALEKIEMVPVEANGLPALARQALTPSIRKKYL